MRFVEVSGGALEVHVLPAEGAGEGRPPVVFLHDGLGSAGLWRDVPERVRQASGGPLTVTYSRHGYGRSSPPPAPRDENYLHHEAHVVLPELLARLGIEAPVLIGHSDGASIALLHAGAGHPVTGIAALAPHVFVEPRSVVGVEAAKRAFESAGLRDRLARHHVDVDVAFSGWCDVWLSPEFRTWNIEDHLGPITCPVLLVQGEADAYGTLAQLDAIASGVPGPVETLVLPGIGHAPQTEAPDATIAALARFVSGLGGPDQRDRGGNMAGTSRFERSHAIDIAANPAEVLDYVSNPTTWPQWMPATHHIDSPDRPLRAGEHFSERWRTRRGEVALEWSVVEREDTKVWEARTETEFIGPIIARYTVEDTAAGCRYTRTILNPARPKPPTAEMITRIDDEAAVCLANIKRNLEARPA